PALRGRDRLAVGQVVRDRIHPGALPGEAGGGDVERAEDVHRLALLVPRFPTRLVRVRLARVACGYRVSGSAVPDGVIRVRLARVACGYRGSGSAVPDGFIRIRLARLACGCASQSHHTRPEIACFIVANRPMRTWTRAEWNSV